MKAILFDARGRPLRKLPGSKTTLQVVHDPPAEVAEVIEKLSPEDLKRARTMQRLGGGPLHRAAEQAKQRIHDQRSTRVRSFISGIRSLPVR